MIDISTQKARQTVRRAFRMAVLPIMAVIEWLIVGIAWGCALAGMEGRAKTIAQWAENSLPSLAWYFNVD